MKTLRSALSLAITFSLVVLPRERVGAVLRAPARRASASASGIGAAETVKNAVSIPTAALSISALTPSISLGRLSWPLLPSPS